jgi:DNA mismatch endonuclease (patch repair protein)
MPKKLKSEIRKGIIKPIPSSKAALQRMRAAKPRDTAPEKALRLALYRKGLRYRIDVRLIKDLNRRADIVFRSIKVAVFVDGCFWHGCPIHGTQAKANAEFWSNKIRQNQERDADTSKRLRKAGWRVIRVWEHENLEKASEKDENQLAHVDRAWVVVRWTLRYALSGSQRDASPPSPSQACPATTGSVEGWEGVPFGGKDGKKVK